MEARRTLLLALLALSILGLAAPALAHVERTAYWPDPRPDTSVKPAAGGDVPKTRSLQSALNKKLVGDTRVVCQPDSLKQVRAEIGLARRDGITLRPTQAIKLGKKSA